MSPDLNPIPEGYPRVTPYLIVDDADDAIDFYRQVFGATERMRMDGPDGKVGHAEIQIGDAVVMLADEFPDMGITSAKTLGGTPVSLHVYVEDVDKTFDHAIQLGAKTVDSIEDKFYGDRSGTFEDPYGHRWNVASHVEDVPPDEMAKRAEQYAAG